MTYKLVGTGNIAHFLASRLSAAGFVCEGVYGRNEQAVANLAILAGAKKMGPIEQAEDGSDCCILAVSDDALEEVGQLLKFTRSLLVHTAGSRALTVLQSANRGVLWCIYSISEEDMPMHRQIPVVIEGSNENAVSVLQKLGNALSDSVVIASYEQRQFLHLAAVIGNNFSNHLMAICERICLEQGLSFALLRPILEQTFQRINTASPAMLQTGPARRGDTTTMDRQLELLHEHPEWQNLYRTISASIEKWY